MSSTFTRATHWAVALILMVSAHAFAADGVIKSASGDIFVNGAAASQGDEVSSGDTLKTAFGAWMVVEMDDQSVLDVRSDTEVEILAHVYSLPDPSSNIQQVDVLDGTLRFTSGLIGKNDQEDVQVLAGSVSLGIRGTSFQIIYNTRTGKLSLKVLSGTVKIDLVSRNTGGFVDYTNVTELTDVKAGGSAEIENVGERVKDLSNGNIKDDRVLRVTVTDDDGNVSVVELNTSDFLSLYDGRKGTDLKQITPADGTTPNFNQAITNTDE